MAWTFIQQLPNDTAIAGRIGYRMSVTNGSEIRTEYVWSLVVLTSPQLIAAKNAVLNYLNAPPPRPPTIREVRDALVAIANDATLTTKAAKWDAAVAYYQSIVGAD